MSIVNFPHNPTCDGRSSRISIVELVALAKKYGFLVISDFAYADICFDGYVAPSFLATPGAIDVGVEFTTMSKGYSMAGWRIGFCCGNAEMVRALATIKGYYDYGIFQADADRRHRRHAALRRRHRKHCRRVPGAPRRPLRRLERLGWDIETPKAGMFVWAKIPEPWAQMGSIDFAMKLLDEGGVAVSPGRGFGEEGEGYLRLASSKTANDCGKPSAQIGRCMKAEPAPAQSPGRTRTEPTRESPARRVHARRSGGGRCRCGGT